jgi:hypothetical protein
LISVFSFIRLTDNCGNPPKIRLIGWTKGRTKDFETLFFEKSYCFLDRSTKRFSTTVCPPECSNDRQNSLLRGYVSDSATLERGKAPIDGVWRASRYLAPRAPPAALDSVRPRGRF